METAGACSISKLIVLGGLLCLRVLRSRAICCDKEKLVEERQDGDVNEERQAYEAIFYRSRTRARDLSAVQYCDLLW